MKYRDISIMSCLLPVLGVLRLLADSVAHLPVLLGPVVVPGPHGDVLCGVIWKYFSQYFIRHVTLIPLTPLTSGAVSSCEDRVSGQDGAATKGLRAGF